ncbi:serine/threonine-protein kinase gin4 [Parahypoxylon ruwenzoriense]
MADSRGPTLRSPRAPLGDATDRVNNASSTKPPKPSRTQIPQPSAVQAFPTKAQAHRRTGSNSTTTSKPTNTQARSDSRISARSQDVLDNNKRDSRLSTTSTGSGGRRRKTHIGPWELGKSLGNGSAARVRLVRHNITSELAAVKILSRNADSLTHPGSIAALDKWDRTRDEYTSENRIPFPIEREVAILKLIDHPNIVKLYDIWENRSEIYLVLEYVQRGDLYGYLSVNGPLSEVETMFYFRQMLSALEYVHSFNLCHRDLKPENILLTEDGRIKMTDFGMSALHQSPNHMLKTACGSPHYAAPELISSRSYRGDSVDIWSLGVILYACLSNTLPFSDDHTHRLLMKVQKGVYRMPPFITTEAKDLISRMLQVEPEERISTRGIWQHLLLRKYDHLDDLNDGKQTHEYRQNGRYDPVPPEELDMQTLRQLKSVWHTFTEKQLAVKLTSPERNDFKLFYWLLCNYREKRLENYGADLSYSASDYHHLQPPNWKKKYTTLEFPGGPGRNPSRFTVISNVATDENGDVLDTASTDGGSTVASYDPYKSSRVMEDVVASRAKIIIHRNGTSSTRASRLPSVRSGSVRSGSTHSRPVRGARHLKAPIAGGGSRRSLNSIMSGEEISYKRPASIQKRGVEFSHARKRSADRGEAACRPASIPGDHTTYDRDNTSSAKPVKRTRVSKGSGRSRSGTQSMTDVSKPKDRSLHWNEELRHFSNSIAKDCDDAFNSSLLTTQSYLSEARYESPIPEGKKTSPVDMNTSSLTTQRVGGASVNSRALGSRPLPPPPSLKDPGAHHITAAKKRTEHLGDDADKMVPPLNQLGQREGPPGKVEADRRVVSAPIYSQYSTQWGRDKIPLPSINEMPREDGRYGEDDRRIVSAPATESSTTRYTMAEERAGLEYLAQQEKTIRLVSSPSDRPTARKRSPLGVKEPNLRQQYINDQMGAPVLEESLTPFRTSSNTSVKKKSSWFKRSSKDKDDLSRCSSNRSNTNGLVQSETNSSGGSAMTPAKKKGFGFAFWRGNKDDSEPKLSLAGPDFDDSSSPEPVRMFSHPGRPPLNRNKTTARNIEPQQNWLARLFRVKPATRYICFSISRRRVRQEIAILLREWRCYGMRDIVVDKERNLVFARVAQKNSLDMKEASFAAEIMQVIEHGKRNHLCIVRFTQERGAASTFNKVITAMEDAFRPRCLLVTDKRKAKMMVKTLNS